ncbi:MAG: cation:proton antiporter [Euryarchaeota archaeon]|nr:cation:proton antiporter [Euryarchaeota archaeon]
MLGPFAVGALMSRHPVLKQYSQTRMGEIIAVLFLPAFFVLAGMNVDLTSLDYPEGLWALGVVIAVATVAKLAGVFAGARASGIDARESLRVGLLLNTRGAVGLVVAEVGLQAGLLSTAGFSLLVIMIAVTTLIAPVALGLMQRGTVVPERLLPEHHEA